MSRGLGLLALLVVFAVRAEEPHLAYTQADRLEYQEAIDAFLWDLQGWYGGDINKLWWKLEGEMEDGSDAENELQLLYSRAISPYFDLQLGARYEDEFDEISLVIGWHGLAPYRFEVDTAAFINKDGDVLLRGEFERDLLLTQRIVLQPRLELNAALQEIPERSIDSGITDAGLELRVRYEINRQLAPYVGISWQRVFGDGGRALRDAGLDDDVTTFVVGARFWF